MRLFILLLVLLAPLASQAASFPYITLNSKTNRVSDNGTNLTYNGSALAGGGGSAPVGTVVATTNMPSIGYVFTSLDGTRTNGVWSAPTWEFNASKISPANLNDLSFFTINPQTAILIESDDWDALVDSDLVYVWGSVANSTGAQPASMAAIMTVGSTDPLTSGDLHGWTAAMLADNKVTQTNSQSPFAINISSGSPAVSDYGLVAQSSQSAGFNVGFSGANSAGLLGLSMNPSTEGYNGYGVLGISIGATNLNLGGGFAVSSSASNSVSIFGELGIDGAGDEVWENSVMLLDNRTTGLPLITARTNNGTTVFRVPADGSIAAGTTNQWKTGGYVSGGKVGVTVNNTNYNLLTDLAFPDRSQYTAPIGGDATVTYTNIVVTNMLVSVTNDIWTVPSGKLAYVGSGTVFNSTNASLINTAFFIKTNGNYFRMDLVRSVSTNGSAAMATFSADWLVGGETLACTNGATGLSVYFTAKLFDITTTSLKICRALGLTNTATTLYTVPNGKVGIPLSLGANINPYYSGSIRCNTDASVATLYKAYIVPSGGSANNSTLIRSISTTSQGQGIITGIPLLDSGSSIVILGDQTTSGQSAITAFYEQNK